MNFSDYTIPELTPEQLERCHKAFMEMLAKRGESIEVIHNADNNSESTTIRNANGKVIFQHLACKMSGEFRHGSS